MNYHKSKFMPEHKGTDLITVKCQKCGKPTTRSMRNLRRTLRLGHKVTCENCSIETVNRNYKFVEKIYEIKKISKSLK